MKKMQCEVCGSNEIKKVGDDIFECQSCGVQYSKDEVQKLLVEITGSVKIDHSQESENMVKRAKQFEERGDQEKAKEYYEKALDLDPENQTANAELSQIHDVLFLDRDISSDEATKNALNYLYQCEDVVPDLFANISKADIVERYCMFSVNYSNISGAFTGTSCYEHKVQYTDHEEKTVFMNNGTRRTERVPVTKYRTEVDKKPANGSFKATAYAVYSVSDDVGNSIAKCDGDKIDDKKSLRAKLFNEFEIKAYQIIQKEKSLKELDFNKIEDDNGIAKYNDTELKLNRENDSWLKRSGTLFAKEKAIECRTSAKRNCPGDYVENLNLTILSDEVESLFVLLPIQIITYKYKSKEYIIVQILNKKHNEIAATFPADKKTKDTQKDIETITQKSQKTTGMEIATILTGAVGGSFCYIGLLSTSMGLLLFGIALLLLITLPCGLAGSNRKKALRTELEEIKKKADERNNKIEDILEKEFKSFNKEYNNSKTISQASSAIKQSFDSPDVVFSTSETLSTFGKPVKINASKSLEKIDNLDYAFNLRYFKAANVMEIEKTVNDFDDILFYYKKLSSSLAEGQSLELINNQTGDSFGADRYNKSRYFVNIASELQLAACTSDKDKTVGKSVCYNLLLDFCRGKIYSDINYVGWADYETVAFTDDDYELQYFE